MARVLVIGDPHAPATAPGYIEWCTQVGADNGCDTTLLLGDVLDLHRSSVHVKHPKAKGTDDEFEAARATIRSWCLIGGVRCLAGNHEGRVGKRAAEAGIPSQKIKSFNEALNVDWEFATRFMIDGVYYTHGTAANGEHPAWRMCKDMGCSVVLGHSHTAAGIKWIRTRVGMRFGMDVGCGCDEDHPAFAYAEESTKRPILGCAVVIDGWPVHFVKPSGEPVKRQTPGRRRASRKAVHS